MAAGNSSTQNFRKAIGVIKDSTLVGMAKVNSEYKGLKVSIVKATNHVEVLPKEKHVRTILGALSGSRPRPDVVYCIHALTRRLAKTHSWVVALKTLIVIHRALREVDLSFCEELIYYNNNRGHLLNLLQFKDESSLSAWDYSAWIRTYALYIEECLECFRVLKYDFHRDYSRTKKFDTPALLEHLPALQELLFRLLACQPVGAARHNFMIQYALSIVVAESVRLYVAITDGVLILVDKFFEMQRRDAVRALEIYRKSGEQAQRLSEFFDMCRGLDFGRMQKYVKIEQPPASFLTAMEEYVKDAPQTLMLPWRADDDDGSNTPKVIAVERSHPLVDAEENPESDKSVAEAAPLIPDLLSWDEPCQEASKLADTNTDPLSMTAPEDTSNPTISPDLSSQPVSWELALVPTPSSNAASVAQSKGGGLDRSTLDSLYDMAQKQTNPNGPYQMANVSSNPFEAGGGYNQEMFYAPSVIGQHPNFMQMVEIPQQQAAFIQQQQDHQQTQAVVAYDYMQMAGIPQQQPPFVQQQESSFAGLDYMQMVEMPQQQEIAMQQQEKLSAGKDSTNPFGNPFVEQSSMPCPPQSQPSNVSLL